MKRGKSSRELRRQQQRHERNVLADIALTPAEQLRLKYFRNGITEKDVQQAYEDGIKDGRKYAEEFAFHAMYAAFLITMIDNHGMSQDEAVELLKEIDRQVVLCVEDEDLMEEAYAKTGIELSWADAIQRVTERDDAE